jgi:hypothetical protein
LFPELDPRAEKLFSAYDDFLGLLANYVKRERLDTISFDDLKSAPTFKEAQQTSQRFWDGNTDRMIPELQADVVGRSNRLQRRISADARSEASTTSVGLHRLSSHCR